MWERWHPEVALRYLPIVKIIQKSGFEKSRILEVGSGGLGIGPYLQRKFVGMDKKFLPPISRWIKPIKGEAKKIPFEDKSFEIVIAVDVLEHLPREDRYQSIKELVRVGKNLLIIAFPSGEAAKREDEWLEKWLENHGKEHDFVIEHQKYGLPKEREIKDFLYNIGIKKVEVIDNENIWLRRFLMSGWLTENLIVDIFFRKVLLFFVPIFCLLNQKPVYRKILTIWLTE